LGALNLSRFVTKKAKKHVVDWENLGKAVEYAVRFLDNVVDLNFYFMDSIGEQQLGERRVGLGIMGLAEMLVRLELRYGSTQGNEFIDELGKFIAMTAYRASADLAAAKGAFPKYDPKQIMESGFIQSLPAETQAIIKANGLRNVTLLTVAPTGTTGTMVNTSTGVEPYFSWSYFRTSRLGVHEETVDVAAEWKAANPGKDLPKWFVNAMDLTPEEHVTVQAKLQRWIDSSISKTCNVPSDYTIDQTRELYELMYELGCKGGTIYRDGSRDEQVLSTAKPGESEKKDEKKEDKKAAKKEIKLRERPRMARGLTIEKDSPVGRVFVTVNVDNSGNPIEIFVTAGKAGSDVTSMAEGIGRACSFALQLAGPMTSMERLSEIAEQFTGIGGTNVVGIGKNQIRSLPEAVAKAIEEIAEEIVKMQTSGELEPQVDPEPAVAAPRRKNRAARTADICPSCGAAAFIREEGCQHCTSCGHSRC
jgi:ribonucleoside-diphosphate reductase alpha chain